MRLLLLSLAVITACDPYVASEVVLNPAPSAASVDSIASSVISMVDTLARRHGLAPWKWPYSCTVGSSAGTYRGSWKSSSTWLTVCVTGAEPFRVDFFVKELGFHWSRGGDSLRHELPDSLRSRFGVASVTVIRK